ncbi:hypothetical protein BU17DRAFT_68752 [Hysterangium stoloniferum]|nr:hypothetical protein BU17DRAFT_68752 [Hysterangium stoloniferum]
MPSDLVLEEGTIVVVELDTDATLEILGYDPQNLVDKVNTSKYAAVVGLYDAWGRPLILCELHFLGTGMPVPHQYYVTDEDMSVPLQHDTGPPQLKISPREPYTPLAPLPSTWKNCYQHTLMTRTVLIGDMNTKTSARSKLSRKDMNRLFEFTFEDRDREERLFAKELAKLINIVSKDSKNQNLYGSPCKFARTSDNACYPGKKSENVDLDPSLSTLDSAVSDPPPTLQPPAVVSIVLDLSVIISPPDPRGFFEELRILQRTWVNKKEKGRFIFYSQSYRGAVDYDR